MAQVLVTSPRRRAGPRRPGPDSSPPIYRRVGVAGAALSQVTSMVGEGLTVTGSRPMDSAYLLDRLWRVLSTSRQSTCSFSARHGAKNTRFHLCLGCFWASRSTPGGRRCACSRDSPPAPEAALRVCRPGLRLHHRACIRGSTPCPLDALPARPEPQPPARRGSRPWRNSRCASPDDVPVAVARRLPVHLAHVHVHVHRDPRADLRLVGDVGLWLVVPPAASTGCWRRPRSACVQVHPPAQPSRYPMVDHRCYRPGSPDRGCCPRRWGPPGRDDGTRRIGVTMGPG